MLPIFIVEVFPFFESFLSIQGKTLIKYYSLTPVVSVRESFSEFLCAVMAEDEKNGVGTLEIEAIRTGMNQNYIKIWNFEGFLDPANLAITQNFIYFIYYNMK